MAIQFVGRATGGVEDSNTSYSVSLTSLTGGIASAPATGDVVVVVAAQSTISGVDLDGGVTGYTEIADLYRDDVFACNLSVCYKVMGGSPDSSITVAKSNHANAYAAACIVEVWRGVDPSVLSGTSTTATGIDTDRADAASITPAHVGSVILACCAAAQVGSSTSLTGPSGMSDIAQHAVTSASAPSRVVVGHYTWASGAYNPAALTGGNNGSTESWCAVTLALRPAPSTHYVVYLASATDPADNSTGYGQIIAGQDGSGAAGAASGSIVAPTADATDSALATITGLSPNTAYAAAAVWWDGASDYGDGRILSADITTSSAGYTLTGTAGTYSVSGQSATLTVARHLVATAGAYVATGQSAALSVGRQIDATAGAYATTGLQVGLHADRSLGATAGSYAVTGNDVTLTAARALAATAGEYAVAGKSVTLAFGRHLAATAGSYAVTGQSVVLHAARSLAATAGNYTTTGHDVELTYAAAGDYSLDGTAGAYTITGRPVTLRVDRTLQATAGSYAVTGGTASLDRGRTLTAQAGSYVVTGNTASMLLSRAMAATAGVYTVTGSQVVLDYSAAEEPTVYTAAGRRRLGAALQHPKDTRLGVTPLLPPDRRVGRAVLLGGVPRVGGQRQ